MECALVETVDLSADYLFIGEIVGAYAKAEVLDEGKPAWEKVDPLILTMPDNRYWKLDTCVGNAWKDGWTARLAGDCASSGRASSKTCR